MDGIVLEGYCEQRTTELYEERQLIAQPALGARVAELLKTRQDQLYVITIKRFICESLITTERLQA